MYTQEVCIDWINILEGQNVGVVSEGMREEAVSPADKKNYCDRVDQSMKLGMQVQFGIYNSIRRGAKKNV